jgi:hypothetical protein
MYLNELEAKQAAYHLLSDISKIENYKSWFRGISLMSHPDDLELIVLSVHTLNVFPELSKIIPKEIDGVKIFEVRQVFPIHPNVFPGD